MDRVLEIGHFAAGFCGRLCVDAGHDVVRVEPASPLPGWASPAATDLFLHAGKRRISTADPDVLAALAARADIVVLEAAGADAVAASGFDTWTTPVKVAITPFGRTGPRRNWHATPAVLLAMGGYTQIVGDAGREPLTLPGHYVEFQSAHYAYAAASACRYAGERSSIDVSMLETVMSLSQFTTVQWHCLNLIRTRHGNDLWSVCPSTMYRLADGWACVTIVPAFWDAFTVFLDAPELVLDERFASNDARMANRDALHERVGAAMLQLTAAEAEARAEALRIPLGVVKSLDEVLDDPHLAERGFWRSVINPAAPADGGAAVRAPAVACRISNRGNDEPEPVGTAQVQPVAVATRAEAVWHG